MISWCTIPVWLVSWKFPRQLAKNTLGIDPLTGHFPVSPRPKCPRRDLLRSNEKYLEVPVPHGTKSFTIVGSNNVHPAQLDPTIGNDLVQWGTGTSRYFCWTGANLVLEWSTHILISIFVVSLSLSRQLYVLFKRCTVHLLLASISSYSRPATDEVDHEMIHQ